MVILEMLVLTILKIIIGGYKMIKAKIDHLAKTVTIKTLDDRLVYKISFGLFKKILDRGVDCDLICNDGTWVRGVSGERFLFCNSDGLCLTFTIRELALALGTMNYENFYGRMDD